MTGWCTPEEVGQRMPEQIPTELCQMYIEVASEMLYTLSGRKYPMPTDGLVVEIPIHRGARVKLNNYQPVRAVTDVKVGGASVPFELSPAHSFLTVRLDGDQETAERIAASRRYEIVRRPHLRAEVTMNVGQDPPLIARRAASALAAYFLRGDPEYVRQGGTNPLPDFRLQSLSRQGTSWTYTNPVELMKAKLTGEYEVDLFLRAVNPTGSQFPSMIKG